MERSPRHGELAEDGGRAVRHGEEEEEEAREGGELISIASAGVCMSSSRKREGACSRYDGESATC